MNKNFEKLKPYLEKLWHLKPPEISLNGMTNPSTH